MKTCVCVNSAKDLNKHVWVDADKRMIYRAIVLDGWAIEQHCLMGINRSSKQWLSQPWVVTDVLKPQINVSDIVSRRKWWIGFWKRIRRPSSNGCQSIALCYDRGNTKKEQFDSIMKCVTWMHVMGSMHNAHSICMVILGLLGWDETTRFNHDTNEMPRVSDVIDSMSWLILRHYVTIITRSKSDKSSCAIIQQIIS